MYAHDHIDGHYGENCSVCQAILCFSLGSPGARLSVDNTSAGRTQPAPIHSPARTAPESETPLTRSGIGAGRRGRSDRCPGRPTSDRLGLEYVGWLI